jgi:hypothetical protein
MNLVALSFYAALTLALNFEAPLCGLALLPLLPMEDRLELIAG